MKQFPDIEVERLLRFWWNLFELYEIYTDLEDDEFIQRCFKGYDDMHTVHNNQVVIRETTIEPTRFTKILEYFTNNKLTMDIISVHDFLVLTIKKRDSDTK